MAKTNDTARKTLSATEPKRGNARRTSGEHVVMTGYPGFLSKQLLREILSTLPRAHITVLVEDARRKLADSDLSLLDAATKKRVHCVSADVTKMDLGLSGVELDTIRDATLFFHLAGIQRSDARKEAYDAVNVHGVRNVIALCRELQQLKRLVHFSTCLVSGAREGVITEDELDCGQAFRNAYEESKFRGEKLARQAMGDLPITVLRPSLVVGSSRTGEVERFDGIYVMGLVAVSSPVAVPLPLPGTGTAPLHVVPVDFVTRATVTLACDPRAAGKTFHIVDPNPLSTRHVYELIAKRAGKRLPRPTTSLASRFMSLPVVQALSKRRLPTLNMLESFVVYNCSNTLALLDGTGVACPRFDTYVDKLIAYVTSVLKKEREAHKRKDSDPFDAAPATE